METQIFLICNLGSFLTAVTCLSSVFLPFFCPHLSAFAYAVLLQPCQSPWAPIWDSLAVLRGFLKPTSVQLRILDILEAFTTNTHNPKVVGRSPRGTEVLRLQGSRCGAPRHSPELGSLRTPSTSPFLPPGDSPPFFLLRASPPHTLLPLSETPLPKNCQANAKFQLTTLLP